MDTADRGKAPRTARARTDGRRCGGDEEDEANGEVTPPLTAIPGHVDVEPPTAIGEAAMPR